MGALKDLDSSQDDRLRLREREKGTRPRSKVAGGKVQELTRVRGRSNNLIKIRNGRKRQQGFLTPQKQGKQAKFRN